MKDNEKIMIAGCAAGAGFAAVPAVYGFIKAMERQPINDRGFLKAENGGFFTEDGVQIRLRGVNLNDDFFWFVKDDLDKSASCYDVYSALSERFGPYGARLLAANYAKSFVTPSDIKRIAKTGASCVRVPLRYFLLTGKENCKGDIDFENLDLIVKKCKKAGVYVILDLHSAPGFQNTGSAAGKDTKSVLFSSAKEGFEARNATVRLWSKIAEHFKDEPAIAAYDLLNRPLSRLADWENELDTLHKLYRRIYKAIRNVDEKHTVILQAAGAPDTFPNPDKYKGENVAYGIYSHFHTTYEIQSLLNGLREYENSGIPVVVCKLRAEENLRNSLDAMNDSGISWLFGDFKGEGLRAAYIYGGSVPDADLAVDTHDEIKEKWSKPLATKNFEENKEITKILKNAYQYGAVTVEETEKENKPKKFNAKFGMHLVKGR